MIAENIKPVESDKPFSEYLKTENAREKREARGEFDPTAGVISDEKPQDATTEAKAKADRDEGGKFKAKLEKPEIEAPKVEAKPDEKPDDVGDPRKSHQARINQAIAKQRDAERRAEAAEAELQRVRQPQTPSQPYPVAAQSPTGEKPRLVALIAKYQGDPDYPKWEDFVDAGFQDPYTAYNAAQSAFINEKLDTEREQTRQASQRETEHRSRLDEVQTIGATKHADWDAIMESPEASDVILPEAVLQEIYLHQTPDFSADIVRHLVTHPDDLMALQAIGENPIAAARAIARLPIGQTSAPSGPESQPRPQTKAKPLIKPVSSAPVAAEASDPESLDFGPKYIAAMNARERKERMARRG